MAGEQDDQPELSKIFLRMTEVGRESAEKAGAATAVAAGNGATARGRVVISADVGISAAGEACVIRADAGISELAGRVTHSEKEHQISLWITVHVFETVSRSA